MYFIDKSLVGVSGLFDVKVIFFLLVIICFSVIILIW